jgi:hypothetical protein
MVHVTVAFANGNVVEFDAEEFNVDLYDTPGVSCVSKFTYKDHQGNNSAVHLKPEDVAGIFITPYEGVGGGQPIGYAVAGRK